MRSEDGLSVPGASIPSGFGLGGWIFRIAPDRMQRSIPWFWILIAGLLLLAPGLTARLFVDVLEGVTLLLVVGPLVLAGAGLLAWQLLRRRLAICPACGTASLQTQQCPACGASLSGAGQPQPQQRAEPDARDAVIDVQVREVMDGD